MQIATIMRWEIDLDAFQTATRWGLIKTQLRLARHPLDVGKCKFPN
jgi:hypothetical protein